MMAYYAGERMKSEGVELLDRATRRGLDSKMFDPQALVLLAFVRLDANEHRSGLQRCQENLERLIERQPDKPRLPRLLEVVKALVYIQRIPDRQRAGRSAPHGQDRAQRRLRF